MIKKTILLLFAALMASCTQSEQKAEPEREVKRETGIEGHAVTIDVRSAKEFESGHLEQAVNIPHTEIADKIADQVKDKDAKIEVYCKSGTRAGIAQKTLQDMGYTNVHNTGGYEDLKAKADARKE